MAANDKLLIVTQKVDREAPILGFFHEWIRAFAEEFSQVTVICLERGEIDLPENVTVHSLGKELGGSRLQYLKKFYTYIFRLRNEYYAVLVHMNPLYVLLGGLFWRLQGKKVLWWKTHGHLSLLARLSTFWTHKVLTASKGSFPLDIKKKFVVGHGIDTNLFSPRESRVTGNFLLLSAGRLSPVKHIEDLIVTAELLQKKGVDFAVKIVGPDLDTAYANKLKDAVREKKLEEVVRFAGSVPQSDMSALYQVADILVNTSDTDSIDKVVLEAMASGVIPITSNEAFREILEDKDLFVPKRNIEALAEAIIRVQQMSSEECSKFAQDLRKVVVENHSLKHLAKQVYEHATT